MFRLIENQKAKNAYYHEMISVHLYTLDELCYFLETHVFLVDDIWAGEPLFAWLEKELFLNELAMHLRQIYRNTKNISNCVEEILRYSGNYTEKELLELHGLLTGMDGKTDMERRKVRADLLLDAKKYRQAGYLYLELLRPECARRMTEELRGNILHNLGVVYARLFLFQEAAQMFAEAYRLRKDDRTRQAYLFAMNYVDDSDALDEQEMGLNFTVMRDALNALSVASNEPENYVERKEASRAADAFDWKSKQTELVARWKRECREMLG